MTTEPLSRRMVQIVVLIGRDRLSYKAIGRELGISWHTVRQHAEEARDRIGSNLSPRDALTAFYWQNRETIDSAA